MHLHSKQRDRAIKSSAVTHGLPAIPFLALLVLIVLAFAATNTSLVPTAQADQGQPGQFKLIELYTSHGCSSCPKADKLLGELIEQDDELIALEFHVDYWNSLVHGKDGSFTDPYSQAAFSARQRQYNAASLKGRPGVYTPQAVINGRFAAVGSNKRHISKALSQPQSAMLALSIESGASPDTLLVTVTGDSGQLAQLRGTNIMLARYLDTVSTDITGGENRHKTLVNHHVVTEFGAIGEVSDSDQMRFEITTPAASGGCVVLVQEDALTPVYAAATCP